MEPAATRSSPFRPVEVASGAASAAPITATGLILGLTSTDSVLARGAAFTVNVSGWSPSFVTVSV